MTAIEKLNSIITSVDTLAQIGDDCNFPAVRAIYNATANGRIALAAVREWTAKSNIRNKKRSDFNV